jgi:RNA polymerase sigma-70 factor (ECF subfamily)
MSGRARVSRTIPISPRSARIGAVDAGGGGTTGGSDEERRFAELFGATYPQVRAFVRRRVPPEQVDDVVSETFLAAWRRFDDLPHDAEQLLPWLYRTAGFATMNSRRSNRRRANLGLRLEAVGPAEQQLPIEVSADDERELLRAFTGLDEADRSILLMSAWEGLTNDQIAAVLGCSTTAATKRLVRARERFELAAARGAKARP